ncbi:MAG: hemerythrin domain-containing protein [Aeoliella sp.]
MTSDIRDSTQATAIWVEHQMLEHIKNALRVTVSWTAPSIGVARKRSSVSFAMKSFQRHLERLMGIEEEGGYMFMVADAKPNMQHRISRLREEHEAFRREVDDLIQSLDELTEWQEDEFEQICNEIKGLLDHVDKHDQAEVLLLQETLLCDEGGEG